MEVLYRLKRNEPLVLDDPEKVWVIQTGNIALFTTKVKNITLHGDRLRAQPEAERFTAAALKNDHRYLFSVGALEALFGAATNHPDSLIVAVAIEATELSQISIADLVRLVATGETGAIALVNGWINHLSETFSTEGYLLNW